MPMILCDRRTNFGYEKDRKIQLLLMYIIHFEIRGSLSVESYPERVGSFKVYYLILKYNMVEMQKVTTM